MPLVRSSRQLLEGGVQQRELFAFALFRVLQAVLLGALAFVANATQALSQVNVPGLRAAAVIYVLLSLLLLWLSHRRRLTPPVLAGAGLALDIAVAGAVMAAQQGFDTAVGLMLLFNITIGSLVLGPRAAFAMALTAAAVVMLERALDLVSGGGSVGSTEPAMLALGYVVGAALSQFLRRELARTEALAEQRGGEVAQLTEVNELVIRRMRTGVIVVDANHRIRLFNEAAWALLGAKGEARTLVDLNPYLDGMLRRWRATGEVQPRSLLLSDDGPELLPRFAATGVVEELFLVFLDDARIYSGRAEEMTLATLGRLSASVAHEIRNPLAAILHAAQLLDESPGLPEGDRRLLEIIQGQCKRMDGIVGSVLGLARRERAQAEVVDLPQLVRLFLADYAAAHPMGEDRAGEASEGPVAAQVDPRQLQQVLAVLLDNARAYGHASGAPARILLRSQVVDGQRVELDVIDNGPGITPAVAARLFEPFYTTSEHGTGLGLYIARQLCEANQGSLQYVAAAAGGACFRIRLPRSGSRS